MIVRPVTFLKSGVAFTNQYSMLFDGINEYINTPSNAIFNFGSYTLSAWVKTSSITPQQRIISRQSAEYWVMGLDAGKLRFCDNFELGCAFTTETVNDGLWHQVAVVRDITIGDKYKWYIDGALKKTVAGTNTTVHSDTAAIEIGQFNGSELFNGNIDEISVWNLGLSATQISEIYNGGTPTNLLNHPAVANLIFWSRQGDEATWNGTIWTFPDASNNGAVIQSVNMEEADRVTDVP